MTHPGVLIALGIVSSAIMFALAPTIPGPDMMRGYEEMWGEGRVWDRGIVFTLLGMLLAATSATVAIGAAILWLIRKHLRNGWKLDIGRLLHR